MAKAEFITFEVATRLKVGSGILQSRLTHAELMVMQKLMEYPRNPNLRPKYMALHTTAGTLIVPYTDKD
jgi:hypothetical protein